MTISKIFARQIIDSRANPTIEVDLYLEDGSIGRAAVPSGASTGEHEALELRDNNPEKFLGKSVENAIKNVNVEIAGEMMGKIFDTQEAVDSFLLQLDGSENKSRLGANAILGVSLAFAHAVAQSRKIPLFKLINEIYGNAEMKLPRPMFNIMNGGRHANWATDIQEFMIVIPNQLFNEQMESASEIFLNLGKILEENKLDTDVGNEGGYAPGFKNNAEAFEYIIKAIDKSNFKIGEDIFFAVDIAASEFYNPEKGTYTLKTENRELTAEEWMNELESWIEKYPFLSIEDPFAQDDWGNWTKFTSKYGSDYQIVGDDLLVTNTKRIERAISEKSCNSLLVKLNQIGTLTETINAMKMAQNAGWTNIVSHRSGETEDVTIAHLAVGTGCGQIKTGAPSRGERTAKYNELLRISEELESGD